ncbi:MAG: hypothetical protein A3J51_06665 [Omnitrophica WOR_2 bacterium RIFCSPHIGHO2_02_FULL_45_21]|nr:MAG: hypothetical protein A3J51_06665 [Omnitrophica WOR_2 bacterium RIFCSPHIGHO2_02_FULL_45_21]
MNEREFVDKSLTLSFEFNRYLIAHPEVASSIPKEAQIFFILEDDPEFTKAEKQLAESLKKESSLPQIFIKVQKLIPPFESRLLNPQIVSTA